VTISSSCSSCFIPHTQTHTQVVVSRGISEESPYDYVFGGPLHCRSAVSQSTLKVSQSLQSLLGEIA